MHAIVSPPIITPSDRLGLTVFVAIVVHAIVILGVTFAPHDRHFDRSRTLDVILVQSRTDQAPEVADFLAQANQDGGGESPDNVRPATPQPPPFIGPRPEIVAGAPPIPPSPPREAVRPISPQPKSARSETVPPMPAPRTVLTRIEAPSPYQVPDAPAPKSPPVAKPSRDPAPEEEPDPRPVDTSPADRPALPAQPLNANTLVSRSLAMASLSAEIDKRLKAYAKRPRRKWVTARTREHKYAAYMEAWRAKVERVGNLNYPDDARRRNLGGDLLLDVALNADGSVNEIILRRSSGHRLLDEAAMRIVDLAGPYARFPAEITQETDILHIERTWVFSNANRFTAR